MPRTVVSNNFIKGMKKDKALTKSDPEEYLEASNLRISTDETGQSVGSLATIKGNEFEIAIPNVGNVVFIEGAQTLKDSLPTGLSQSMEIVINGKSITFTHAQSELDQFYKALSDHINTNTNNYPGHPKAQWKELGVIIYSLDYIDITSVSAINWTVTGSPLIVNLNYVPKVSSLEVIGQSTIRDTLILFTTDQNNTSGTGQIWAITWNDQNVPKITLVRHGSDNFKKGFDIEAVGRYESSIIQRVYWTDHNNPLRSINIYSTSSFLDEVNITPAISFDVPYVIKLNQNGGSLVSGWYTYAYRQKNLGGAETTFSRFSQPFPINKANEETSEYWEYEGSREGEATSKSISLKIDTLDKNFSHIDIIVGYMGEFGSTPTYSYVYENKDLNGADSLIFTHSKLDEVAFISEAEVLIPPIRFSKCKTLAIQDNRLFVGNVSDDLIDITSYEANAFRYRYKTGSTSTGDSIDEPYVTTTDKRNPYNSDSNNKALGSGAQYSTNKQHIKYQKNFPYKQGGTGKNISYEFITKEIKLDSYTGFKNASYESLDQPIGKTARVNVKEKITSAVLNKKTIPLGGYWNNFKNPFIASYYRGYMRSEIYRFGIVFFDKSGRILDTKWIDDIRMPEAYDFPIYKNTIAGNGTDLASTGEVNGYSLGLKFNVSIPQNIKNVVSGFSIVRAERTELDETIIGQGLLFDTAWKSMDDKDGEYGDKTSSLKPFMYRCDRIKDFARVDGGSQVGTFTLGMHQMYSPEFLMTSKYNSSVAGFSIRPIAAIQPKASRGFDQDWLEVSNTTGSKEHCEWTKFYGTPIYFEDRTNNDNIAFLSATIRNGKQVPALTTENPGPKVLTDDIYTTAQTYNGYWGNTQANMNGFINLSGPFGSPRDVTNASALGNDEQQFRAKGTTTYTIQSDYFEMAGIYCSVPGQTSTNIKPSTLSRIMPSEYYQDNGIAIGPKTGLSSDSVTHAQPAGCRHLLFNIYRELSNQYGGFTKSNIQATEYISTGHYQKVESNDGILIYECEVFGGDTYVNLYDQEIARAHWTGGGWETKPGSSLSIFPFQPKQNSNAQGLAIIFPVESRLNLDWRIGYHTSVNGTGLYQVNNFVFGGDVADVLQNAVPEWSIRQNNSVKTYSLSDFSTFINDWDNRIWASEVKTNGEPSDSWTVFKPNNFFDVDGNLGPINKLEKFNNDMLFFQDRGFGKMVINPNPVLNTADDIEVSLGTGKVLHDSTYYSTNVGTKHQWSVISSSKGVYWFDIINKKPYYFSSNGLQEYSDVKGLHSFFTDSVDTSLLNFDSPSLKKGIRTTYDYINNEILFTFLNPKTLYSNDIASYAIFNSILNGTMPDGALVSLGTGITYEVIKSFQYGNAGTLIPGQFQTNEYLRARPSYRQSEFTISYSEVAQSWNAFYDFKPTIYLNTGNRLLSPDPLDPEKLYLHNVGKYNTFYGVYYPSILELITAPAPDITKVFDNVSWHSIAKSSTGTGAKTLDQITFSKYFCYNDYQHSGEVILNPTTLKKIEREWQMAIPRNVVTSVGNDIDVLNPLNWDFTQTFKDRIRDKYLIQHFEYNNNTTDQFVIDRISTYIRKSSR